MIDIMYTTVILGVGIAIGMYIATQISEHINKNINESYFTSRNKRIKDIYKQKESFPQAKKDSHGKLGGNLEDVHMRESVIPNKLQIKDMHISKKKKK